MGLSFIFVILAALGLGFLVFIHELGHYFVAKWVGIKVEAFSIGFGKPIVRWMRGDIEWRIGWLPFGGYVRMAGMDKQEGQQPYEVEGGFFAATPWDRIKVALAGPVVNLVFALILFCVIWGMGGREKAFSDFTHRIGWIDPQSELYELGLRPGDIIDEYDGYAVRGAKDHLYAAMLSGNGVEVKGYLVDYSTDVETPFEAEVSPYSPEGAQVEGLRTLGVLKPAQYLLYLPGKHEKLPAVSPLKDAGLEYGDRLFWADGQLLFSHDQLAHILNAGEALVTVKRGGKTVLERVPRVPVGDLVLPPNMQQEVGDWHYEWQGETALREARFVPYNLTPDGVVEEAVPLYDDGEVERTLQVGDQILAIDGHKVSGGAAIFEALQTHQVNLVVQRNHQDWGVESWRIADASFDKSVNWADLEQVISSIGVNGVAQAGQIVRLPPVTPITTGQFARALGNDSWQVSRLTEWRNSIQKIEDPEERKAQLAALRATEERLILGVPLADRPVRYNPNPFVIFADVVIETWRTMTSLVMGYLSPKWLSGPVGIVQAIHYGWTVGVGEALFWLGVISLNLGILNLLPIPVLDGGHICFSLWEKFTKRRIKAETMEKLIIPFVVLLIAFFVFATYQDLSRLFRGWF